MDRLKRLLDILAAFVALTLAAPAALAAAAAIRASMGAPVLFRQDRGGLHGRVFTLLKFRTMIDAHDAFGHPLPDARRLTALGRFLRRTSLDELPQLWNVLRGEMSLVGPRPLLARYLERYDERQRRRHEVRPGMTGWAQVSGRNALSWEERFELDVWYVDHRGLALDVEILARTAWAVAVGRGAGRDAETPEFWGTHAGREAA